MEKKIASCPYFLLVMCIFCLLLLLLLFLFFWFVFFFFFCFFAFIFFLFPFFFWKSDSENKCDEKVQEREVSEKAVYL